MEQQLESQQSTCSTFSQQSKREQVNTFYSVRRGTIDYGREYEFKMLALMVLRCIRPETEEASFAFNADGCSDFDDLIIYRRINGNRNVSLIQLKHQIHPKCIKSDEFLAAKGNFSLTKYEKSYQAMERGNFEILQKMFNDDNITFDNIELVLYTNKEVDIKNGGCTFLNISNVNDHFLMTNGTVYNFDENDSNLKNFPKPFLQKLHLFSKQVSVSKIDLLIKDEVDRIVPNTKINSNFCNAFVQFLTCWAKGELGGHYILTKSRIIVELTELMFDNYVYKFCNLTPSTPIAHEITKVIDAIVASSDILLGSLCDDAIIIFFRNYLREHIDAISKAHPKTNEIAKVRVHDSTTLYRASWRLGFVPLVLVVENDDEFSDVTNILANLKCSAKFTILGKNMILNDARFGGGFKVVTNLSSLNDKLQELILNCDVKLQGRGPFKLHEIINDIPDCTRFISINDIISVLSHNFNIGDLLSPLPQFYVPRKISKIYLKVELFNNNKDICVVLSTDKNKFKMFLINELFTSNYILIDTSAISSKDLSSGKCVIVCCASSDLSSKMFDRNTHYLKFHSETNSLEWLKSYGSIANLRTYLHQPSEQKFYFWSDFIQQGNAVDNKTKLVNIISGEPGIGKSIAMSAIAIQTPVDKWVLRVDLNKYINYFNKLGESQRKFASYKRDFSCTVTEKCANALNKMVFEHYLQEKKILFLFDGFDEISPDFKNCVTQIIHAVTNDQYPVWLTTRPVTQLHVERQFNSFAYTLKPFTEVDQFHFLNRHLNAHCNMNQSSSIINLIYRFVENLLKLVHYNLGSRVLTLIGIPLHTKILADVFIKECSIYIETGKLDLGGKLHVLSLYEKFIELKENEFLNKFEGNYALKILKSTREYYGLYALTILFRSSDLGGILVDLKAKIKNFVDNVRDGSNNIGIVLSQSDGNLAFIHRSFAEYYVALWLASNCQSSQYENVASKLIKKILVKPRYELVKSFFDAYLGKNLPLHSAVTHYNLEEVVKIVAENKDSINFKDKLGRTALTLLSQWATKFDVGSESFILEIEQISRESEITKLLLEYTTKNEKEIVKLDSLKYAVDNHCLCILNGFATNLRTINVRSKYLKIYMFYCALHGLANLMSVLLRNNAKLQKTINSLIYDEMKSNNLLHLAAYNGRVSIIAILLANGADISSKNRLKQQALHIAANFGHQEIVAMLLSKRADISSSDVYCKNALHYAAEVGSKVIIETLLAKGVNLHSTGIEGKNALHYASKSNSKETVELILSQGVDINSTTRRGKSSLHIAALTGSNEIVKMLLLNGININLRDHKGKNALHYAASRDVKIATSKEGNNSDCTLSCSSKETVEILLLHGLDVNSTDDHGNNALHHATWIGSTEIVELLISKGININLTNGHGRHSLHFAAMNGFNEIIELLLSKQLNINSTDNDGRNALFYVPECHYKETVQVLLVNGININSTDHFGRDAMLHAAFGNRKKIVEMLLSVGVSVNSSDDNGQSALHIAAFFGYTLIAELLISNGININLIDKNGQNALDVAEDKGHGAIVKILKTRFASER